MKYKTTENHILFFFFNFLEVGEGAEGEEGENLKLSPHSQ